MERLLFKRIEIWVVLVLAIAGLIGTLAFGVVTSRAERSPRSSATDPPLILKIVHAPGTLRRLVRDYRHPTRHRWVARNRFEGMSGFDFSYPAGTRPDAPYYMLNRYDGDTARSVSELVDLNTQEIIATWTYDVDDIWPTLDFSSVHSDLWASYRTFRFRGIHADLAPDGTVVTQGMHTPLLKYDLCGNLIWANAEYVFHHSIERLPDGSYWVPIEMEPKTVSIGDAAFHESGISHVSPDGEILEVTSVAQILIDNDLGILLYGRGFEQDDPLHLNDIQPVLTDGVLWRKGDLFLSLRNQSMIVLYRPETGKILWHRVGPWIHQHDVNILDDRRISVFDNHAILKGTRQLVVDGTSGVWIVDVPDNTTSPLFPNGFKALELATEIEGRARLLDDGRVWVEETKAGRAVSFDSDGTPDWTFVNRAGDGKNYLINWSRIVDRDTGDAVRKLVEDGACLP